MITRMVEGRSRRPRLPARTLAARLLGGAAVLAVAGCTTFPLDLDLRNRGDGFTTAEASQTPPDRPRPDDRGIISYPGYQVAVAQRDDTVRAISARLGFSAEELARFNGIDPDVTLRRDEVIALPRRVAEPSPATGAATTGPIRPPAQVDVTTLAGAAIDRAGPTPVAPAPAPAPAAPAVALPGAEPIRHRVLRGETTFSLARLYNVPARSIAEWNGLGPDLAIREGQYLLIPAAGSAPQPAALATTNPPGSGSPTPVPPSAAAPLPAEVPVAASAPPPPAPPTPDIGATTPAPAAAAARLARPVEGAVIRAYAPGRNEGIDIAAPAGTAVRAAGAGEVRAVTTDTNGINIVVIRHEETLLTVYTHLDNISVSRGDRVSRGQSIGQVRAGDPSFLHFEVRLGRDSADPTDYLP